MSATDFLMPKDKRDVVIPIFPGNVSLEEDYDTSIDSATEFALVAGATAIEVVALAQALFFKWTTTSGTAASSTDYDHLIPAGIPLQFEIPVNASTGLKYTAVSVMSQTNGAAVGITQF